MSKNGPNKTVAAARRRMGGFPPASQQTPSDFMTWVFEQASAGVRFKNEDEARAEFNKAN